MFGNDIFTRVKRSYSQVKLHADYGGVVPELASRDHVRKTVPQVIKKVEMTEPAIPISTCRPQGVTLRRVLSLIFRQYRFHRYFLHNK